MDDIENSSGIRSIPPKKISETLRSIIDSCKYDKDKEVNGGLCDRCSVLRNSIYRYAKANIPVEYWRLEMDKDFKGDEKLLEVYYSYTKNLSVTYRKGRSVCFSGSHGLGKTMVSCCILKKAVEKGFSGLYVNLTDVIHLMTSADSRERFIARKELMQVDFLVIDEFDSRYIGSENAADLFGRTIEDIIRSRSQNKVPTIFCTNNQKITDGFSGSVKKALISLTHRLEDITALGKDYRKNEK